MPMQAYRYEVRNDSGQVTTGMVQAASLADATGMAKQQGGYLLSVSPVAGSSLLEKLQSIRLESGPGLKDVMAFTSQLAVMIRAGINIRTAIESIAEQTQNQKFQKALFDVKNDVEGGKTFSEALGKHPKIFSFLYVNMIKASELSGNLGHMLDRIRAYLQQQMETRRMVIGAMVYPMIICILAISTVVFMLTWVLPRFTGLFAGKEDLLPAPTVLLLNLSDMLRNDWQIILGVLGAIVIGLTVLIKKTDQGRHAFDTFKLKMPLFKKMFRALYISRGLQTMGELLTAGVPMLETLTITSDVSGNVLYSDMWTRVHDGVKEGTKIVDPLTRQTLLPRNVVQMVGAGEESGNLGEVLREVSDYYQEELKSTIKTVTSMIEPLMIVVMGAVVGFIAAAIMLPIFKMSAVVK